MSLITASSPVMKVHDIEVGEENIVLLEKHEKHPICEKDELENGLNRKSTIECTKDEISYKILIKDMFILGSQNILSFFLLFVPFVMITIFSKFLNNSIVFGAVGLGSTIYNAFCLDIGVGLNAVRRLEIFSLAVLRIIDI